MITCKFSGGLGNNLFQLAQIYAIHKLHGVDLVIPSFTNRQIIHQLGLDQEPNLELNDLLENQFVYTNHPIPGINSYNHVDQGATPIKTYIEVPLYDNTCYEGYFQSEKYFLGVDISKEFKLKQKNIDYILLKYKNFFKKKTISLHYRLGGDRVLDNIQHYHKNVSIDFYTQALKNIKDYTDENYNILVFTDSLLKCKELMNDFPYPLNFLPTQSNVLDFTMMSLCNHNIVGNSTFSWWAAYLNQHPNKKIIVSESEWLGPGYSHFNLKDTFPNSWIKLKQNKNGKY